MTLLEAVEAVDEVCPNQYTDRQKISWLSKLDGQIYDELIAGREGRPAEGFDGYDPETDLDTELLVPSPYDEDVYVFYLKAQIDEANGEYERFNADAAQYNANYGKYAAHYVRTHRQRMPDNRLHF